MVKTRREEQVTGPAMDLLTLPNRNDLILFRDRGQVQMPIGPFIEQLAWRVHFMKSLGYKDQTTL